MLSGWYELIRKRIRPNHEFVSADVRTMDPRSYEMLGKEQDMGKSPPPTLLSPAETPMTPPMMKSGRTTPDYFGREARTVSLTRVTTPGGQHEWKPAWDPSHTYAKPTTITVGYTGMEGRKVDTPRMNNIV